MTSNARAWFSLVGLVGLGSVALPACSSDTKQTSNPDGGHPEAGTPCGDGEVGAGESCDTAIAAGKPGACPTACDDHDPCTVDTLEHGGTCTAACNSSTKTAPDTSKKDACCPSGATAATDADCSPTCGNGKLDSGETCDTAITSGAGACQTSCPDDGDPCTTASLVTADPCNPTCTTTTITTPKNGDSCCPAGATAANDSDCTAACGNGTVDPGEDCDETSAICHDCKFVPTAFHLKSLTLTDPHAWVAPNPGECDDITDAVNTLISNNFASDTTGSPDGGADGKLDLSFVVTFRPLRQTGSGNAEFHQAACDAPSPPQSCGANPKLAPTEFTYSNKSTGTCFAPDPNRVTAAYHATPDGGATADGGVPLDLTTLAGSNACFVSDPGSLTLTLAGITVTFEHAVVSGQWQGDPATGVVEGVFTGFLSESVAQGITLPASLGSQPLSALFPTGTGDCSAVDDRDVGPDGTTRGWWWFFNFEAEKVTWTSP
jgi:hypothetical protein